ncbi:hypothetical protein A3D72_02840 [Candidatus Uhrbacteria bacterium RIFCSPHIGHO2_02_FULL_57_19]|uniref:Uncharacterized protein n=1 Tax=Candidatus Uhrbacteria bacterium RIFCSPHIGHO2_02_FULL_57_19 TaxID=1802391 RepID=A0A1F7U6Y9_9BACT|nr:MAG: hypothetical protein A3D72_02840 [Candidatus Uhrbacteria bacterium RIFCSPHIGHO2_02_FULL_57_19]
MPASLISIPVLAVVLLIATHAAADGGGADGIYFTAAYIVGSVLAIGYKTLVACVKYVSLRVFRLGMLLYPMFLAILIAIPTVFYALPHLGPPSGKFAPDMIYAFLTTYTIFDITGDAFKLTGIMTDYFRRKGGGDATDGEKDA